MAVLGRRDPYHYLRRPSGVGPTRGRLAFVHQQGQPYCFEAS